MKRIVIHPEEPATGKRYWRSLSQLARTPSAQEGLDREFPVGSAEMRDEADAESSRRSFLKLMGASTALAGLAACRRPEMHIRPYAKAPEWVIPGKVLFYATAMPRVGGATPMVVHTHEGRPTHLQGNKLHPDSNGGLDSQAQASILNLYDPSRAKGYTNFGKKSSEKDFLAYMDDKKNQLGKKGGAGLAILIDEVVSPTRARLLGDVIKKYPSAKVYRHEEFGLANVRAACTAAFGDGAMPVYHFEKADRVFALDCDFLGLDRLGNKSVGEFMSRRKAEKPEDGAKMNRLYVVEGRYTLTGGMADHRLRVKISQTERVAHDLARALGVAVPSSTSDFSPRSDYAKWIELAAADLKASAGKALVVVGSQHHADLQLVVAAINEALGAFGKTIEIKAQGGDKAGNLLDLAVSAGKKEIETLLVMGEVDPVYSRAGIIKEGLGEILKANVPTIIVHTTRPQTATARIASWIVPATHYLEQWGDTRGFEGSYAVVQPMIAPLYDGCLSDIEVLQALLTNEPLVPPVVVAPSGAVVAAAAAPAVAVAAVGPIDAGPAAKAVRDTFNAVVAGATDIVWNNTLRDGYATGSVYPPFTGQFNRTAISKIRAITPATDGFEVVFVPCSKIHDGRYVNNGWLQEAPDPVAKNTWDNVAVLSVATARELGINLVNEDAGDVISVEVNGVTRWFPVLVIPGHSDKSVTLTVGYGQKDPGLVGKGSGFDAYPLRSVANPYFSTDAKVAKLTEAVSGDALKNIADRKEIPISYPLGLTAEHHSMFGRALVRSGTTDDWKENKDFVLEQGTDGHLHGDRAAKNAVNAYSLYKPEGLAGKNGERTPHLHDQTHQWGMVIDLNSCTGCTSCLVACQSENNIPIVGKDQVIRGREMHWIRMDRYFATDLDSDAALNGRRVENNPLDSEDNEWNEDEMDDPEMLMQPVGCQHCEAAPCETVCPVNATVHSPDGLNVMAYNRCIGTRYCANNCPFKVRRFNFFDYNKRNPLVKKNLGPLEFGNLYAGPAGDRHDTELSKLQKNPNVSVRMRGVIEKCTYCLQRIEGARIETRSHARKNKARETGEYGENLVIEEKDLMIPTDSLKTACQEACPAQAIMFGNINDDKSSVVAWKNNSRNYELLGYLSVRARTTYLARIKNPNPELVKASPKEAKKVGQGSKTRLVHPEGGDHSGGATATEAHH